MPAGTAPLVSRRLFLFMAAALAWPQKSPDQRSAVDMIIRSKRPEDLEMPGAAFGDFITPIERFFVRTHVPVPNVDLASWRLRVDGHVSTPLTLSMNELRSMPSVELIGVLECAGNGRSFFEPSVAGLQWANGAVGNGRWRGVRLRDLLQRTGVKSGTVEILFDGADTPIGTMADFQRSIPLKKALDPNTLLAYEMNGEALPAKHGFPLRAVVPGWAGDSWAKWVTNIHVLDQPSQGFWMKNAYLIPDRPVAPGATPAAETMRPITTLRVKSIIASPDNGATVALGQAAAITGAAWSGEAGNVVRVDVSIDEGRSWKQARLSGESTPFGWRLWSFSWTPSIERHYTVLARARDSSGDVQPVIPEWNPGGYLWNAIARVDVDAGKNPLAPPTPPATASSVPELQGFRETCLVCHDDDVIRQQHLTRVQWEREINKMTGWGARVAPERRQALLDYLESIAGPRR